MLKLLSLCLVALSLVAIECGALFTLTQARTITQSAAGPLSVQVVVTNAAEAATARDTINNSGCQGVDVLLDGAIDYDFDIYPRDCASPESLHTRFRMTPGSVLLGGIRAWCDDVLQPTRIHCGAVSIEGLDAIAPPDNDAYDASGGALVVTIDSYAEVPANAIKFTNVITGHGTSRFLALNTGGISHAVVTAPTAPFTENTRSVLIGGSYTAGFAPIASAYNVGGTSGGQAHGQAFGVDLLCQTADGVSLDIEPGFGGHATVEVGPTTALPCGISQEMERFESFELTLHPPETTVALVVPFPAWITGTRHALLVLR